MRTWLKGLLAAVVAAVGGAVVDASVTLFQGGAINWDGLGKTAIVAGIVGCALYFKQSPIPK